MKRVLNRMTIIVSLVVLVMSMTSQVSAKVSNRKIFKGYSQYLQEEREEVPLKYFALVDANKDGSPELLAVSKMKGGKIKGFVDFVSFCQKDGKAYSSGEYGTTPYLYYNTVQKGILFEKDQYEYMNGIAKGKSGKYFVSNAKMIVKKGKKYAISEGHISGEYGIKTKKVSASVMKKYRKSWAFSKKSRGTKKVKFFKKTKANLKKLQQGKIKIQK